MTTCTTEQLGAQSTIETWKKSCLSRWYWHLYTDALLLLQCHAMHRPWVSAGFVWTRVWFASHCLTSKSKSNLSNALCQFQFLGHDHLFHWILLLGGLRVPVSLVVDRMWHQSNGKQHSPFVMPSLFCLMKRTATHDEINTYTMKKTITVQLESKQVARWSKSMDRKRRELLEFWKFYSSIDLVPYWRDFFGMMTWCVTSRRSSFTQKVRITFSIVYYKWAIQSISIWILWMVVDYRSRTCFSLNFRSYNR